VPEEAERTLTFKELMTRLSALIRPHWKRAVAVGVLLLATLGLEMTGPVIIAKATNNIEAMATGSAAARAAINAVAFLGILYLAVSGARAGMMYFTGVEQERLTQRVLWSLRRQLYQAMQRLSFSFFDRSQSGQLISRVTSDVQRVARFFNAAFFSSLEAFTILGGITVYMFYHSALLAVVALSTMPVTIAIVLKTAMKMRLLWRDARDSYGEVTTVLQENIAGIKVVRAFAKEKMEIGKFSGRADDYVGKVLHAIYSWATRVPVATTVYGFNAPIILIVGGYLVVKGPAQGGIELGTLFAFVLYTNNMAWRVEMLGHIMGSIATASGAADRIYEILDARPQVDERPKAGPLPPGKGRVEFKHVTFAYVEGKPVLRDINFSVQPGQFVALVGHTGAGKTALVSLVPRFYDVNEGAVAIDGVDVRDVKLDSLRRNVALIFQETFLFSATVRENIAYARPDASMDQIREAAEAAQAAEFIDTLDDGYETVIGERGVTLSGGQRQRLAIARAILADPRILVMDDATASVDSSTERLIQEGLFELSRGRTTFVIAHRIHTVRRADLIVVLEAGRIVEMGVHDELLAAGGVYRNIYDVQLAENREQYDELGRRREI